MAGKRAPAPKRKLPAQRAPGAGSKPRFPLRAAAVDVGSNRRSAPKAEHETYAVLDRKEKAAVLKLSSLMRFADAMDRERRQKVYSVKVEVKDGLLRLRLEGQGDLLLEGWSLKKKGDLLKKAFGLALEVASSVREGP